MYIKEMYQTILTKTDMNAIARLRGFDKQSLLSNQHFAKYFHSAIGLDCVLASLSDYEKVFLYCMGNEWVDVAFFAPLYKKASEELARKYDTFTQKYSETYKAILENLIRKGILVVRQGHGDSKLARLRFQVLDLLSAFLTNPFMGTVSIEAEGTVDEHLLRAQVAGCLTTKATKKIADLVHINEGQLRLGESKLTIKTLQSWQYKKWYRESTSDVAYSVKDNVFETRFKKQLIGAFETLPQNTWVKSDALKALSQFMTYPNEPLNHNQIMESGYALGCLKKTVHNGTTYYAASHVLEPKKIEPEVFLETCGEGFIIDIKKIPYHSLAQLTPFGYFKIHKKNLFIHFEFRALTQMDMEFLQSPLLHWMRQQLPLLESQVQQIQLKHGKVLLHKNLLIAKVNDVRLKAHLIKAYQESKTVVFLPNDYLALPVAMKPELERLIKKAGYAIRTQ